jgi:prepilin-type N-terminal cleavage/methylation domain-containing protein
MIMKMNKKGVTLLELIVVMAIIAIGAVLTVPSFGPWLANYRLRTATRDITSTLRTAQMKAVSNNVDYEVFFAGSTYILRRNSLGIPVPDGVTQTLPNGISIVLPVNNPLTFSPNSSSNGGTVTLTNTKGSQRAITVSLSTGRIAIQ